MSNGKRTTCNHDRRPRLFDTAPTVHNRHDPEQHDNGHKRQLTPHHLTNLKAVDACYLPGDQNRNTHRAKCHWRGVNNQAQSGGVQWFKAQTDQQCGGNCYRCAKACGSFKERAETETDDQHLQTLVRGYRKNRRANDVKLPGFHRDLIDEHRCNNDPRDGPQPVEETINHRGQRVSDRHFIEQQSHGKGDCHRPRGGDVSFQFELNQRKEEKQDGKRCYQTGKPDIPGGIVVLLPEIHCRSPGVHAHRVMSLLLISLSHVV